MHRLALAVSVLLPVLVAQSESGRRPVLWTRVPDAPAAVRIDAGVLRRAPPGPWSVEVVGVRHELDPVRTGRSLDCEVVTGRVRGGGTFGLARTPDGVAAGWFAAGARAFELSPIGRPGVCVVREIDPAADPLPCRLLDPPTAPRDDGPVAAPPEAPTTADVMVVYTARARSLAGGTSAIHAEITAAVERASLTNLQSAVELTFRLVHLYETAYVEDGTGADLGRFAGTTDGFMDEVHALRTSYGADLMHLVTDPPTPQYCGIAYSMAFLSVGFRSAAFAVTIRPCFGNNTLCHEIGHGLGCQHDRANAQTPLYPYSYGYRTPDQQWRTVMAYVPGTRVDFWSSPLVSHQGQVLGVVDHEDNARSIRNAKATVAAFLPTTTLEWMPVDGGIPGLFGEPTIRGEGTINLAAPIRVSIGGYRPNAPGALILGPTRLGLPILGGVLVPLPAVTVSIVGGGSDIVFDATALAGQPTGAEVWFQAVFLDAAAMAGVSASDGLGVVVP